MKSQNNIESMFREREEKLRIQPSDKAWAKLESRLDRQAARPRPRHESNLIVMRRWLAVAASLLVLTVSIFTFSTSSSEYDYLPTIVGEISGESGCNPFCMNIEARKKLPAFYAMPSKDELKEKS